MTVKQGIISAFLEIAILRPRNVIDTLTIKPKKRNILHRVLLYCQRNVHNYVESFYVRIGSFIGARRRLAVFR